MAKKVFKRLDFSKVKTYPVTKRFSKVESSLLGKKLHKGARVRSLIQGLPNILAAQNLKAIARKIAHAHRTNKTVLPNTNSCAIFAGGADCGTKMTLRCPTLAHRPDKAAAALPVLAVVMISALRSRPFTTAIALARSLNEAVGRRPSSLTHTCFNLRADANRSVL